MRPQATLRRGRHEPELQAPVKPTIEEERDVEAGRRIVCAACGHAITTERQRIEMHGRHEHRCVNPGGVIFHIACFRRAPGCVSHGVPTVQFTWFSGFAWSYALCAGCSTLLGWKYQGVDASPFFGLILDRLATARERSH
jgi:hypothetical protein